MNDRGSTDVGVFFDRTHNLVCIERHIGKFPGCEFMTGAIQWVSMLL